MGAFFLRAVDQELGKLGLFYVRFMDDIVVLAPTRWKLRAAVKALNQGLGALRLAKHPGKTFIGRIEKGFDFLGYHFSPQGLTLAQSRARAKNGDCHQFAPRHGPRNKALTLKRIGWLYPIFPQTAFKRPPTKREPGKPGETGACSADLALFQRPRPCAATEQ